MHEAMKDIVSWGQDGGLLNKQSGVTGFSCKSTNLSLAHGFNSLLFFICTPETEPAGGTVF